MEKLGPSLLASPWAWVCLGGVIIQHAIGASSALWLVRLINDVQNSLDWGVHFALVVGAFIIPYVPAVFASIAVSRWKMHCIDKFSNQLSYQLNNKPELWADKEQGTFNATTLSSEVYGVLDRAVNHFHHFWSCGASLAATMISIVFVIDWSIGLGFACSALLGAACLYRRKNYQEKLATNEQLARSVFAQGALRIWDNITLGNHYHANIWNSRQQTAQKLWTKAATRNAMMLELTTGLISLVVFGPTLSAVAFGMYRHRLDVIYLSACVVTLPRIIQSLNYVYAYFSILSKGVSVITQVKNLEELLHDKNPEPLMQRIQTTEIRVSNNQKTSKASDAMALLNDNTWRQSPGRWTVRGPNGAGKSTLLLELKRRLGEDAYLFPAHHHFDFKTVSTTETRSTGEQRLAQLQEIIALDNLKFILLDEWDANLDEGNKAKLDECIKTASESKIIIEVRHHQLS